MLKLRSSPSHKSPTRYLTAIKNNAKTKHLSQKPKPRKPNSNCNRNIKTKMPKNYILSILSFVTIAANMHTVPAYTMN
jgi:hypothetical protein